MRPYTALSVTDKVGQMQELSNIVLGIRLFNRAIDKGGVGLCSFDELWDLMSSGNKLDQNLNDFIIELVNESENYNHFLRVSSVWLESQIDKSEAMNYIEKIKGELI